MKRATVFTIAAVALVMAFVVATLLHNVKKEEPVAMPVESKGAAPATQPAPAVAPAAALVRMHSPTLGNSEAPVTIVEFLDPACEACRAFYPIVKDVLLKNPDRVRLVLRYAPFHRGADKVVALLDAARRQGKFWPALEVLLATQDQWAPNHTAQVELAWKQLERLGLDPVRLRADMESPASAQIVAQDLADARTLNVDKTPSFFVNGRPLVTFGQEPFERLVNDALKESSRR